MTTIRTVVRSRSCVSRRDRGNGQVTVSPLFFAAHFLTSPTATPNSPLGLMSDTSGDPPTIHYKDVSIHRADSTTSSDGIVSDGDVPQRCVAFSPLTIPSEDSVVFKELSFFTRNSQPLPSPDEVRVETERRHPGNPRNGYSPLPVHYPHLGLTVKYGERVVISEGQCLWGYSLTIW